MLVFLPSVAAFKISDVTLVSRHLNLATLEEEETSRRSPQPLQSLPIYFKVCAACIHGMIETVGLGLACGQAYQLVLGGCPVAMGLWLLLSSPTQHRAEGHEAQHSWLWSKKSLLCQKWICFPIIQNEEKSH